MWRHNIKPDTHMRQENEPVLYSEAQSILILR